MVSSSTEHNPGVTEKFEIEATLFAEPKAVNITVFKVNNCNDKSSGKPQLSNVCNTSAILQV